MRWWDDITNLMDMSLSKLWELVMDRAEDIYEFCATIGPACDSVCLLYVELKQIV